MTNLSEATTNPGATRKAWRMLAAGAIILCSGIAIGGGLGLRWALIRDPLAFVDPEQAPVRLADMVAQQLGATSSQRDQILHIFESKRASIDTTRAKIYPEMREILDEVRREVSAVLSPEQAKLWEQRFELMLERWRPKTPSAPIP